MNELNNEKKPNDVMNDVTYVVCGMNEALVMLVVVVRECE